MPRVNLTLEDKKTAEIKRREEKQNSDLRGLLKDKILHKIGYDALYLKTGISKPTLVKIVNHPETATVGQLRLVCNAVDIPLVITGSPDIAVTIDSETAAALKQISKILSKN